MSQSQPRKLGNFEVVREIAEGGMGVVYLARQPALDRSVADQVWSKNGFILRQAWKTSHEVVRLTNLLKRD